MARKILVPEEELHSIADAINNRAEYLEDMNGDEDHTIQNSMVRNSDKQMQTANMADNIMKMYVDLSRFYTKDEIDRIIKEKAIKLVFGALPESGEENTFYFINSYDAETEILDLSVYIWQYEEFVKASDLKVDLSVYATKVDLNSAIDSLQDVYQRKLTPGDGIQIDQSTDTISAYDYKLVQSDFDDPDDGLFKFKRAINDDPEHVPALIVRGEGPVVTFHENDNTLHIDIDVDKLDVVTPPTDDRSTKIATTEFVYNVIDEVVDMDGVVHYVIVDDSDYESIEKDDHTQRQEGTLYLYPKFQTVYFGDTEIAGSIRWKILEGIYNQLYIKLMSHISGTQNQTYGFDLGKNRTLMRYQDIFGDPWQGEGTVNWVYEDYTLHESDIFTKDTLKICEELGITVPKGEDIGSEDDPAITFTPQFSTLEVPWYGYSKNGGYLVVNRSVDTEQGVISKLSDHTYFDNTVTPDKDKLGTKTLNSPLDFDAVPLSSDPQFDPSKYTDNLINPGYKLRGWYFDEDIDIEDMLPTLISYICSEQDVEKAYIDIPYDNPEYTPSQIDLYYNDELISEGESTWIWVDSTIRVYSSISEGQFYEEDTIAIKPKISDFHIYPEDININWSGVLYAIWNQQRYTDIADMWNEYINVPGQDIVSGSSAVTLYLEESKSEGEEVVEQGLRYTVISVASGVYSSNSYETSRYKDTLGIFDSVFSDRDFTQDPITLEDYIYNMSQGISEYVENNPVTFVEFDDISDVDLYRWSKTISIQNTDIVCIFVQKYHISEEEVIVDKQYTPYIKGFTTQSNVIYDLVQYEPENEDSDED